MLFFIVTVPTYIPTSSIRGSLFSTSSPKPSLCVFDNSRSKECEVIFHCGFDLHVPAD